MEAGGDVLQQKVSGGVAEAVVDLLEAVEVDAEERGWMALPRAGHGFVKAFGEEDAVGQLGEGVVLGHELDLQLGPAAFGDVLVGGDPAAVVEGLVRDGDEAAVAELLEEGAGLALVDELLAGVPDLVDGAAGVVSGGDAGFEHVAEAHAEPEVGHALAVDAAELFVDELEAVVGVVEADALGHVGDGLLESLAEVAGSGEAPGEVVAEGGEEAGCLERDGADEQPGSSQEGGLDHGGGVTVRRGGRQLNC